MPERDMQNTAGLQELVRQYQSGNSVQPEEMPVFSFDSEPVASAQSHEPEVIGPFGPLTNAALARGIPKPVSTPSLVDAYSETGKTRFDERSGWRPGDNLEDFRAREESGANKLLRGVTKGAITAATTFANTTAGVLTGALRLTPIGSLWATMAGGKTGINNESMNGVFGAAFNEAINNPVSTFLTGIQTQMDELLPNYRTEKEQSEEYQRGWLNPTHWNANFWADFIKNFGFTAGAMVGGATWSKVIGKAGAAATSNDLMKGVTVASEGDAAAAESLSKTAQAIRGAGLVGADANAVRANIKAQGDKLLALPVFKQYAGALIGAFGEGSAEGLMARQEAMEDYETQLNRDFQREYDGIESSVASEHPEYTVSSWGIDENGMPTRTIQFTDDGKAEILRRQQELVSRRNDILQYANEKADDLASTVFLLNIPILAMPNAAIYSRLFGGGWDTARKTASRVAGKFGQYSAGAPTALRALGNTAKLMGTEAGEEIAQGIVSAGAKKVADDKLTYFNDLSYDRNAVSSAKDWFSSMISGSAEYLSDWKNMQEGFMGALTGIFGIPGRGYFRGERGGIPQAVLEAKNDRDAAERFAEQLNNVVNSEDFQNRWKGYVRHVKLNEDMQAALANDDQYSYHNASDNQLASDILMFAKAGRLDDLTKVAERYLEVSDQDAEEIREMQMNPEDEQSGKQTTEEIKRSVKKQAKQIKDAINEYGAVYDQTRAVLPMNTPDQVIDEAVLTTMQINSVERRFLSMLDETLARIKPILAAQPDSKKNPEQESKFNELKEYAEIFSGSLVSVPAEKREETMSKLESLQKLVEGNKELEPKVNDMIKAYKARQSYYNKLSKLEEVTPAEYEEQAESQETVQQEAIRERNAEYKSLGDIRNEYNRLTQSREGTTGFINEMRSIRKTNKAADDFLVLYDAFNQVRGAVSRKIAGIPRPNDPRVVIMNEMINRANTVDELLNDPMTIMSYEDADWGMTREDFENGPRQFILDTVREVATLYRKVAGRQNIKKVPEQEAKTPVATSGGVDPSAPTSVVPDASGKKAKSKDNKTATDIDGRDWAVGEKVYVYDASNPDATPIEVTVDGLSVNNDGEPMLSTTDGTSQYVYNLNTDVAMLHKTLPEQKSAAVVKVEEHEEEVQNVRMSGTTVEDLAENATLSEQAVTQEQVSAETEEQDGGLNYYRTAIPQMPIDDASAIRNPKDGEDRKQRLRKLSGKNFNEHAKELGKDYTPIWNYLVGHDAFRNTVNLKKGDKIKFMTEPDLLYNGKPIIIMYTEQDGQKKILNVMRSPGGKTKYHNLDKFWKDYTAQWEKFHKNNPNDVFVFKNTGGQEMEADVWNKAFGVIDYDYNYDENTGKYAEEKPVTAVADYDPNAPVFWIDQDGHISYLRGEKQGRERRINMGRHPNEWMNAHRGAMFYLTEDGTGMLTPIRLWLEHFRPSNMNNDNATFNSIRNTLGEIQGIAERFFERIRQEGLNDEQRQAIRDEENAKMHEKFADLKGKLNTSHLFFSLLEQDGKPVLHVTTNYRSGSNRQQPETMEGFYLFPNETTSDERSWIGNLTNRIAELGLSVDAKKGLQNKSEISNFEELLNDGLVTTNARSMLPKNVDFFINPYESLDKGFVSSAKQIALMQQPAAMVEVQSQPIESEPVVEEIDTYDLDGLSAIEDPEDGVPVVEKQDAKPAKSEEEFVAEHKEVAKQILQESDEYMSFPNYDAGAEAILLVVKKGGPWVQIYRDAVNAYNMTNDTAEAINAFALVLNSVMSNAEKSLISDSTDMARLHDEYMNWVVNAESPSGLSKVFARVQYSMDSYMHALDTLAQLNRDGKPEPFTLFGKPVWNGEWNMIPESTRKSLEQSGWTEQSFNELNPDAKKDALTCAGI